MAHGAGGQGATQAGTATVLFTDLVDSTALRQALGDDRADEVRRQHDRMLREAIAAHGGREVKGMGDGLMVVFPASAEAVAASVDMQRAVERFNRRATAPLGLRVGISAGDVVWENGDCFGTPVVEARRLCDAAAGGRILASEIVRLLAGSRGGHSYVAVEPLQLKGLPDPVAAVEVSWEPDRGGTFPLPAPLGAAEAVAFVGRQDEQARLTAAWKAAAGGERRVVLVSGEPGVGKTRLAGEVARHAHGAGATVLYGRCDEDLAVPYQPFVEAMGAYVAHCAAADLAEQAGRHSGDLARLLPQLADKVADVPEPLHADPEAERYRLFEAVAGFLEAAAAPAPMVLVLDDLHWAAKPTLLLLRHLLRRDPAVALLVVGTYRDTDLGRGHPLADMLADLRREPGVERLPLHGLDEQEVGEFVEAASGQALDADARALAQTVHAETEGNPFFVGQVLRHLVETGVVVLRDGHWVRGARIEAAGIPEGVREVIGRRMAHLSDGTNAVLSAAAVIGRDFDVDLLIETAREDEDAVYDALEQAEQARLIHGVAGRAGRYTFAHALVRSTLYDEISTTRRLRQHKRVAEALVARGGTRVEEIARHYCECAALGETRHAVEYGQRAAQRAAERLAWEETAGWYEQLLASLDPDDADHRLRGRLLLELGHARWSTGDRSSAHKAFDDAMGEARAVGDADLFAEAAVAWGGRRAWTEAGVVDDELIARLEEALDRLPETDSPLRAMAMARLASELYFRPDAHERRHRLGEEALAMARRTGDLPAIGFVLTCSRFGLWVPGNADQRKAIGEEIVAVAQATGNREAELGGWAWLVTDCWELGDVEGVRRAMSRCDELSRELRMTDSEWQVEVMKGCLALFEGRFADAERHMDDGLALSQRLQSETGLQFYGVQLFALRRAKGGLEDLAPMFEAMAEQYPAIPAWRCGLIYLYWELGRYDDARPHFQLLADRDFELPSDGNWAVGMAVLGLAAAGLGERAAAQVLYDLLVPYEDTVITVGMPADVIGPIHGPLAVLAAAVGRWEDFERHLAAALGWLDANGGLPWRTRMQLLAASVLIDGDRPGDAERARRLAEEAKETSRAIGMPSMEARADELLRGQA